MAPTPLLLVATETRWLGVARMPRPLSRAGFEISLLAPRGSLAEHSRYVDRTIHLPDRATPQQWVEAFVSAVGAVDPALVVPADDMAFHLLQRLVEAARNGSSATARIAELIARSLGDPAGYRASVAKTLLPSIAQQVGVRMPRSTVIEEAREAVAFARNGGYPVVVKRDQSSGGNRVRICRDEAALRRAVAELGRPHPSDLATAGSSMLVQQYISGRIKNYTVTAWAGSILTSYAGEKLDAYPTPLGPSTTTLYHRSDELRACAEAMVRALRMSGFLSLEFIVASDTAAGYLLEINRRLVPGLHRGIEWGVDHCAALHAALRGLPSPTRATMDPGEDYLSVHFPQEWLRDPNSRRLGEHPVDVLWDDPALIHAMLALRHE